MIKQLSFFEGQLPQPLTEKEFFEHFNNYKKGSLECRNIIITSNIKLVISRVIKKYGNTFYEKQDLVSIGIIALINAIDSFDINKNIKFSTYATWCIDNYIFNFLRDNKKHLEIDSIEKVFFNQSEKQNLKLEDILDDKYSNIEQNYERKETIPEIRKLVESLEEKDKEIIMLYFGFYDNKKYTMEEIAKLYNTTKANISRIIKKNLIKLKKFFELQKYQKVNVFK